MPPTDRLEDAIQLLATIRRTVTGTAPETVAACDAGMAAIRQTLAEQRTRQLLDKISSAAGGGC